jgi:hypothetical protein
MVSLRRLGLVVIVGVASLVPTLASAGEGRQERAFAPDQRVWMDLIAGDYTIEAGRDDRIVVRWTDRSENHVQVDVDVRGADASIATRGSGDHNLRVVVELPQRTAMTVRLSAGDLTIRGIGGSKDIHSWAGDVDIEVGRPDDYRSVEASVTAGDLDAAAFDVSKGGLFRSFSWHGPGKDDLVVRLTAGDLRLRR